MNKVFYPKLAVVNIKNNSKTYFPFIITCICTIAMFYIMHSISINKGLDNAHGSESLKVILDLGMKVIGIFSTIFLFYTNSFLIKRRKKEIGLYNVLGLEKKHIAKVLFFESIFTSSFSLIVGLILGIILNKLMFLMLLKILRFKIPFGFYISTKSIIITLILFIGIFLLTLISNLIQTMMLKPISLLKGGEHGEREPKTKYLITIIGLIALGFGYGIALKVKSPLSALTLFFVAVILVMIGTYALFTSGSIALLKLLRKNKKIYYKTSNFISISGMMYRMKQNAVGLANICILSTAVLVMISTTAALYVGMDDVVKTRFPKNVQIDAYITKDKIHQVDQIIDKESDKIKDKESYFAKHILTTKDNDKFNELKKGVRVATSDTAPITIISLDNFNKAKGQNIKLNDDEVVIIKNKGDYSKDSITIEDKTLKVKKITGDFKEFFQDGDVTNQEEYIVLANDVNVIDKGSNSYSISFNVEGNDDDTLSISNRLNDSFKENKLDVYINSDASSKQDFFMLYGGLFFLGIFLGALFLMATVLIIYYKQISEGNDDKERFKIMQKVGMSKGEIKKTIRSQILMVFFMPIISAVIHITFAFPMITRILAVLNLKNIPLFRISTLITILVFTVIYGIVFSLTARVYYKIVE